MRYAKIFDSKVENVIALNDEDVHLMPSDWELVKSDTANIGDDYINSVFIALAPAQVQPIVKKIDAIDFKLRFTAQERVAIYASTDPLIVDFRMLLDDLRLQNVDLTLQTTIDAVNYLATQGLIDVGRVSEILA